MSQKTSPIPDNHVIGVLTTSDVSGIRSELTRAGFPEVHVMTSDDVERQLDTAEAHANPVSRIIHEFANHLSEEPAYLEQYEEEARRGNKVIAVKVQDDDTAEAAGQILGRHGVMDIRFFGRLAVRDMTPESNPSASSDRLP